MSTTHLHEFKSPDRIASQTPVMSLALADQKLGSRSATDSTSHKFMLKGRQSGGMHRGHSWVFRAESYETMLAWYDDIKNLTEKTGAERNAFIQRSHARSVSGGSHRAGSISSDGMEEDEADQVPYSATASQAEIVTKEEKPPERPSTGGKFLSAFNVNNRDSQLALSPSSNESVGDQETIATAGALPGSGIPFGDASHTVQTGDDEAHAVNRDTHQKSEIPVDSTRPPLKAVQPEHGSMSVQSSKDLSQTRGHEHNDSSVEAHGVSSEDPGVVAYKQGHEATPPPQIQRLDSKYGDVRLP